MLKHRRQPSCLEVQGGSMGGAWHKKVLKDRRLPSRLEVQGGAHGRTLGHKSAETSAAAEPFGGAGGSREAQWETAGPLGHEIAETSMAAEPLERREATWDTTGTQHR